MVFSHRVKLLAYLSSLVVEAGVKGSHRPTIILAGKDSIISNRALYYNQLLRIYCYYNEMSSECSGIENPLLLVLSGGIDRWGGVDVFACILRPGMDSTRPEIEGGLPPIIDPGPDRPAIIPLCWPGILRPVFHPP